MKRFRGIIFFCCFSKVAFSILTLQQTKSRIHTSGLASGFAESPSHLRIENSVFEWTTILAMVMYWLIAVAVIRLFVMSKSVSAGEADRKLSEQDTV